MGLQHHEPGNLNRYWYKFGFFQHTLIDRVPEEECDYLAIYSKYFVTMAEKEMSA